MQKIGKLRTVADAKSLHILSLLSFFGFFAFAPSHLNTAFDLFPFRSLLVLFISLLPSFLPLLTLSFLRPARERFSVVPGASISTTAAAIRRAALPPPAIKVQSFNALGSLTAFGQIWVLWQSRTIYRRGPQGN